MANIKSTHLFVTMVIVGTLILGDYTVSSQCLPQIPGFLIQCASSITLTGPLIPPSIECCQALRDIAINCLCSFITQLPFSVEKVIYISGSCGLTIPSGTVCGSSISL
ncbi:hypothetical protein JCGZ_25967 [Jatropha curcas]|uniref:Bifunctional inhibitor/plant lipid transfer protein/seed storage helical domain-containing protein n=1 Tax=Jatropha curcas TaxID=180498 RepID=A0A067JE44_JATCU|nr:hypothetical protein JCGZ_25967 [Jatropha curcas]